MNRLMRALVLVLAAATLALPVTAQDEPLYHDEDVTFDNDDITLAGTLSLPTSDGPHPAVILISGSGPSNRDEALPGLLEMRPFALLADALASHGFAVLRYDDRGTAESTGDYDLATSADLATDTQAALDYLRTRPDINPEQIGLLGHSEGGLIAALVGAEDPSLAFVISMGGPAVPGYDLLLLQMELTMRASGASEEMIDALIEQERPAMDMIVNAEWDALEAMMRETLPQQMAAMTEEQRAALGDPETAIQQAMTQYQHWFHFFLTYDPADAWAEVESPVLALFGDLDTQVDADQNAPALNEALLAGANPDYTIVRFPTGNHLFQAADSGSPEEYATLEQDYLPEFIPTIVDWLNERVG
jgi:pimeloyl-ACP methyl ester carboxylesterase